VSACCCCGWRSPADSSRCCCCRSASAACSRTSRWRGSRASDGFLGILYAVGLQTGLFPLLIFIGVGALTDFGPLLANPRTAFLGAAAQFGIFATVLGALAASDLFPAVSFTLRDAAAIGIIGGADGPTAIFLSARLAPELLGRSPSRRTPTWRSSRSSSRQS
jgi:Na+-transporting methylmalonyl-CoA/oxaloacetate decarboxylase beta subunit